MSTPSLTRLDPTGAPRAVTLLMHGGTQRSHDPVSGRSASWRRMAAMQRRIAPRLHEAGVASWLLRYTARGWNGSGTGPQEDAHWALEQVRASYGEVPVVLLGHSMGARTAAYVVGAPQVVGLVALAPWWQPEDPVRGLRGKHVVAAHGRADKITSARMTRAFLARAEGVASSTEYVDMGRVGHYMLRRVEMWNAAAADGVLGLAARV